MLAESKTSNIYANTCQIKEKDSIGIEDIHAETNTASIGSNNAHNNLMPYISVYIFRRTS